MGIPAGSPDRAMFHPSSRMFRALWVDQPRILGHPWPVLQGEWGRPRVPWFADVAEAR